MPAHVRALLAAIRRRPGLQAEEYAAMLWPGVTAGTFRLACQFGMIEGVADDLGIVRYWPAQAEEVVA